MVNAGHWQAQRRGEDAEASIARYLQIHDAQARSARAELERLRGLIEDASARLLSSFGAIGALSQTLREAVSEGQDVLPPDLRQALDNAVSALQFPDMATQLIDHVVQRIALLEKITQALGCSPQLSAGEFTAVLAAVAGGQFSAPVEQSCMAGGSVELF